MLNATLPLYLHILQWEIQKSIKSKCIIESGVCHHVTYKTYKDDEIL